MSSYGDGDIGFFFDIIQLHMKRSHFALIILVTTLELTTSPDD